MDTKKTIFVSIATTLATMFVVAVLMHMCRGNCHRGGSSCGAAKVECYSKSKCGQSSSCASYSSCSSKKSCSKSSSCSSKSKCSKGKSCSSKVEFTKEGNVEVKEWTDKDGKKVIKKVIKVDEEK